MLCASQDGRGIWGRMDTCISMAESLPCSPETITTLLVGYTQYKIKSLKFEKKETSTQQTLTQVISAKHFIFALFHLSLQPLEVSAITIPILLEKMLPA